MKISKINIKKKISINYIIKYGQVDKNNYSITYKINSIKKNI